MSNQQQEANNLNEYLNAMPGISYRSRELVDWVDESAGAVDPKEALENDEYEDWEGFNTNSKNKQ